MRSTIPLRFLLVLAQVCIGCVLSLQAQPTYDSCLAPIEKVVEEFSGPDVWNPDSIKIDTCGGHYWKASIYAYKRFFVVFDNPIAPVPTGQWFGWEVIDTSFGVIRKGFAEAEQLYGKFRMNFYGGGASADIEFERYVLVEDVLSGVFRTTLGIRSLRYTFIVAYPASVDNKDATQDVRHRGSDLSIWPNPSVGHVEIARPSELQWAPILVRNVLGDIVRTIYPYNPTENIITIQLDALPSGVYMISSGQSRAMLVLQ